MMEPEARNEPPSILPAGPAWIVAAWSFLGIAALVTAIAVARGCVNVPYWDDFDAYLGFLVRIEDASGLGERLRIATEFHNEHRTLTSRAAVWLAHAFGAPMNFRVLGWAGASMLLPAALLVAARTQNRVSQAAAAFFAAAFVLSLQHWENLFWGGSSADHVTVVPLSMLALLLLQPRSVRAVAGAVVAAFLAAMTLAHGLLVFPIGLGVLASQRRWRALTAWAAATLVLALWWMFGFPASPGHAYEHPGFGELLLVGRFWLGLLGAPLAFGSRLAAPWIGGAIVAAILVTWCLRWWREHPYHASLLAFLSAALLAIAVGRAGMGPWDFMVSRYRILSCLILAIGSWVLFEKARGGRRCARIACLALVAAVLGHWCEQTIDHWWRADAFHDRQLAGAAHYAAHGTLEGSEVQLYYDGPKADRILEDCAKRGIFDLARVAPADPHATVIEERPRSPQ